MAVKTEIGRQTSY